jgi:hypothetical protein
MHRALMLSRARQCGLDIARASQLEVEIVAMMDCLESILHIDSPYTRAPI